MCSMVSVILGVIVLYVLNLIPVFHLADISFTAVFS